MDHDPVALRAWRELFPEKPLRKELLVRYSGRFKGYNATVVSRAGVIEFSLARGFEDVSEEIRVGVMQHLLNKLFRTRTRTMEIDLYNGYIKKLTEYAEVTSVDPELKASFDRVNERYFHDFMSTPNLKWGQHALSTLGHYSFSTDTITISTALREDEELLDYVMHHEMLHKKHKYDETPGGMTRSHTKAFREDEKKYTLPSGRDPEKALAAFVRSRKRRRTPTTRSPVQRLLRWFEL